MSLYRDQIAEALAAVRILGATQYAWLGRRSRRLAAERDLDDAERRRYLVYSLGEELYFSFYCHGTPVTARWGLPQPIASQLSLLEAMSQANTGRGSWDGGWTVARVDAEHVVASRDRVRVRVAASDCDGVVAPGATVRLRLPKELPSITPGFMTVLGDVPLDASRFVRVYWNVASGGAAALVRAITSSLNHALVPFELKVADHPLRFARSDASILYVGADAFGAVRATLIEIAVALTGRLRPAVPAFTLELVPGVGLAEDRDGGGSFGARRCALLADAIARAHEQGLATAEDRLNVVADRFAEAGVLIDAPYLEPSLAGRHVL
jgi:hypothetical protein